MFKERHPRFNLKKMSAFSTYRIVITIIFLSNIIGLESDRRTNSRLNSGFDDGNGNPKSLYSVTRYPYPQFREVSPCSCDVTMNKCDIGCCCDKECPKGKNNNSTCIPGTLTIRYQRRYKTILIY